MGRTALLFANEIFAISVVLEDSKGVITLSEECRGEEIRTFVLLLPGRPLGYLLEE